MRFARHFGIVLALAVLAAACGKKDDTPGPNTGPDAGAEAPAAADLKITWSDELPLAEAPAAGIAFWEHPTLSFNSTLIVGGEKGVTAYNMEDGNPAATIEGYDAGPLAVSYFGLGRDAAGFLAFLDNSDNTVRFFGIDNATRTFLPLAPGPVIRGAVRGLCIGRAATDPEPTLFIVQKDKVQIFNLTGDEEGVSVMGETSIDVPGNLVRCAVGQDGVLTLAADDGAIYRLASESAFAAPFAKAAIGAAGDIAYVYHDDSETTAVHGLLLFADDSNSSLRVFDADNGALLGSFSFNTSDMAESSEPAQAFAAIGGNLGALYRNGAIALGVMDGPDGPVVRLAPASSIFNALEKPIGNPVSPRGAVPLAADEGLIIPTNFQPGADAQGKIDQD